MYSEDIISEDKIICSQCKKNFHYMCKGLTKSAFKKQSKNTRNKWIYSVCKYNWENTKNINNKSSEHSIQYLADSVKFIG